MFLPFHRRSVRGRVSHFARVRRFPCSYNSARVAKRLWVESPSAHSAPESRSPSKRSRNRSLWRIPKWLRHRTRQARSPERAPSRDKHRTTIGLAGETGFHRAEASRDQHFQFALTVGGEREASSNIHIGQKREIPQDLGGRHSTGEVFQNVVNGNAQTADAG